MSEKPPAYLANLHWRAEPSPDSVGEMELAALRPYLGEIIREMLQAAEEEQQSE